LSDGTHLLLVTATDLAGNQSTATLSLTIDGTPPDVTVFPIGTAMLGQPLTLFGGAFDAGSGVQTVQVTILRAADNAVLFTGPAVSTGTGFSSWSFDYTPTERGGQSAVVAVTDVAGNTTVASPITFTVQ
jgi:hypothetical protein